MIFFLKFSFSFLPYILNSFPQGVCHGLCVSPRGFSQTVVIVAVFLYLKEKHDKADWKFKAVCTQGMEYVLIMCVHV